MIRTVTSPDTASGGDVVAERAVVRRRRRVLGWVIDYLLAIMVLAGLAVVGMIQLSHSLPAFVGAVASDAGWNTIKLVSHGGHGVSDELGDAAGNEWFTLVAPLLLCIIAAVLVQFLYHAVLLAWRGRTIGKIVAGTRVRHHRTGAALTGRQAVTRALITTASETGLLAAACVLLILGDAVVSVLVWVLAVAGFWINALVALGGHHRTLADRLGGTTVVSARAGAKPVPAAVAAAVPPFTAVAAAVPPFTAVALSSPASIYAEPVPDAAAVASAPRPLGALARQTSQALGTAGLNRTRKLAQQAQAFSQTGADRTRHIGQRALGAVEARRTRQVGQRVPGTVDEDLTTEAEQRIRRQWQDRRQPSASPPVAARTWLTSGLDPVDPPQPTPEVFLGVESPEA